MPSEVDFLMILVIGEMVISKVSAIIGITRGKCPRAGVVCTRGLSGANS